MLVLTGRQGRPPASSVNNFKKNLLLPTDFGKRIRKKRKEDKEFDGAERTKSKLPGGARWVPGSQSPMPLKFDSLKGKVDFEMK